MKYLVPLILLFTAFSCKTSKEDSATSFGGKILHPKSDYVILFDFNKALDTINLKEDNTFSGKIDSITEGLYYFKHGPEHQYIYLEPKDSLLIRLNTWDFDESLVYSGTNANKNNALIESFLSNEKQEKQFYNLSKLSPEDFKAKITELLNEKDNIIAKYKQENPEDSDKFISILNIAYKYPIYTQIEEYIIDNKNSKDSLDLDASFFEHRKKVNMGLDSIMFFHPYSQYVTTRIYSDTYQQGFKKETDKFTVALLKNIDKNIHSEKLKNVYLRHATIRHFYNRSSCDLNNDAFFTFFKLNTDIEDKKKVQRLLNDAKTLHKGDKLPNFKLTDFAGVTEDIKTVTKKKNSVICFINPKHFSDEWVASRIKFLSKSNPDVKFVVINIANDKDYRVKNLDINTQYYLPSNSIANEFITSKYPRAILINKKGIVENGFAALSSSKINSQIANLQKN